MIQQTISNQAMPKQSAPIQTTPNSAIAAYGGTWQAHLSASVACRPGEKSQLVRCRHEGPLRFQKALWPEGDHPVHLLLLHPPGGIAAGDELAIDLQVERNAHALVTTPGAGKWYRSGSSSASRSDSVDGEAGMGRQTITLSVAEGASLEWMPQEVIVHDGAVAHSHVAIDLHESSKMIGSELLVLGRKAHGERFERGLFAQSMQIRRGGQLLWSDSSRIEPQLMGMASALGEFHCSGVLWASADAGVMSRLGDKLSESQEESLEQSQENLPETSLEQSLEQSLEHLAETALAGHGVCGVSRIHPELLLVRVVANHPEKARAALARCWERLRPQLIGRSAKGPRIWQT